MAQLKQVCTVTNGSQTVTVIGTNVAYRVKANSIFMVQGELAPYVVAADAVFDGTNTVVALAAAYQGVSAAMASGVFATDFTVPDNLPLLSQGDVGTAAIWTNTMYKIQALMAAVSPSGLVASVDEINASLNGAQQAQQAAADSATAALASQPAAAGSAASASQSAASAATAAATAASIAASIATPDWNVSSASTPGYIKNKPTIPTKTSQLTNDSLVASSSVGAANGVAGLDSTGKVPTTQLPAAVLGAMNYQGTWNASTNSPALVSSVGSKGYYYKVATAGSTTINGISQWNVGDLIVFNGTTWDKIDGVANEVITVAGRYGAVALSSADISGLVASATTDTTNAANISSGTLAAARLPAFTGDATTAAGSTALTLAASGVTAGTYNSATSVSPITVDAKGRVTSIGTSVTITPAWGSVTGKPTTISGYGITDALLLGSVVGAALAVSGSAGTATTAARSDHVHPLPSAANIGAVASTAVGTANGVASLDATGKVPTSQLPAAVLGALNYQGTWNATTNTPTIAGGTGTKGYYYKVSVAGTAAIDGINQWNIGDLIAFDGTTWDKIDGLASEVTSVAGRVGAVTLAASDISGLAASATTDATNASNLASGTVPAARLPAFSGDATSGAGSTALTLTATGVTAGTYNNSTTALTPITVDAKGRVTGTGAAVTIAPAFSSITGKPTTLAGYGITDGTALGSVVGAPLAASAAAGIASTAARSDHVHPLPTAAAVGAVATGQVGVASGVASLDATGKVPTSQLPASVLGALNYQGTWDASANSPSLASGTGTKGYYYKVATAGATAIDGNSQWNVGDLIAFNGSTWDKVDGVSTEVTSVAGRVGAVTLSVADVSGAQPTLVSGTTIKTVNGNSLLGSGDVTITGGGGGTFTGLAFTKADGTTSSVPATIKQVSVPLTKSDGTAANVTWSM